MADKKITLVLEAKNAMNRGLQGAANSVKAFSERMKGGFDMFAKPILVAGAGLMAFKKGIEFAENAINSMGRASRELKTETLKGSFDNLTQSVAKMQAQYKLSADVFASNNKIFDEQKKSVRELEEANTSLEKSKRLAAASTDAERNAIEAEYSARKIATDSAQAQQDILDEVARKRTEAANKEQQAVKLEVAAREMGRKSVEALSRASDLASQEAKMTSGAGGFLGFFTGYSAKELESVQSAKKEMDSLAKSAKDEQTKMLSEISALRLASTENLKVSAEEEKTIEAKKMSEKAQALELERKLEEERIKLAKETADKLKDLKEKEADALANIEDKQSEDQKKSWQDIQRERERVAKLTVAQFLEESKEKKDSDKLRTDENKNAERLQRLSGGKIERLSKKDQEWLAKFKEIRKAGGEADVAKENLKQMEATKQTKTLESIQTLLKNNLDEQRKLSTAG